MMCEFEMNDLDELHFFLGVELGTCIKGILTMFEIFDTTNVSNLFYPNARKLLLDAKHYQRLIGELSICYLDKAIVVARLASGCHKRSKK